MPAPAPDPWYYLDLIRKHFSDLRDVNALAFTLGINPHTELQGASFLAKAEYLVLWAIRSGQGAALEAAIGTLRARRAREAPTPPAPPPAVAQTRTTRKALHQALVDALPTNAALALMAQFELGENLAAITGATATTQAVFELIQWAEARGHVRDLIDSALAANPTNGTLRAVAADLGVPAPPAAPE
jgi:hypothetical protein